jgi:hypothetical protein
MTSTWVVLIAALLLVMGVYVSWRAGRLDRLHARVEAARTALDLALERRASAAAELASSGLLDPATSLLIAGAVQGARQANGGRPQAIAVLPDAGAGPGVGAGRDPGGGSGAGADLLALDAVRPRDLAESDLTRALRAAFDQPGFRSLLEGREGAEELLVRVQAAAHQVFLARKFYNDAVAATNEARQRPLARVFRLAGKARQPQFFEMDDSLVDLRWRKEVPRPGGNTCPPLRTPLPRREPRGSSAVWRTCSRAA